METMGSPVLNPMGYCYDCRAVDGLPTFSRLVFLYQPVDSETRSIQRLFLTIEVGVAILWR